MNNEIEYRVLGPLKFSGSLYGDFGYEINGQKSEKGYVSRRGAEAAMLRKVERMVEKEWSQKKYA